MNVQKSLKGILKGLRIKANNLYPTLKPNRMIDIEDIKDIHTLVRKSKWLEGKTLEEITKDIKTSDDSSRVTTKAGVGYVIEKGFFGITRNSDAKPDIEHLGVEIKTCPLKYNKKRDRLSVKEPPSLNIINYCTEVENKDITESSLYKKNKRILFVFYIHEPNKDRSKYLIKYVFLWEMDDRVLDELRPDYNIILDKIKRGKGHEIHQTDNDYLTLCPKHGGKFKDPNCRKSKTRQPFSDEPVEVRGFRLKARYISKFISKELGKELGRGGWKVK